MELYLALDISVLDPTDENLETARRRWSGPLLPIGCDVFVDAGEGLMFRTVVSGHSTMLCPIDQADSENVDIQLQFSPPHNESTSAETRKAAVAWMLSAAGGWKLPE